MDFQVLTQAREARNALKNRHIQAAEEKYEAALASLEAGKRAGADAGEHFLRAYDQLIDAIRQNRSDARLYLALAYVLMAGGQFREARKALGQVRKLEPEHPQLQAYAARLAELEAAPSGGRLPVCSIPAQLLSQPDQLHDFLEQQLYQQTRYGFELAGLSGSSQADWGASLETAQQLGQNLVTLREAIGCLEHEFETGALLARLKPLETLQTRFQGQIRQHQDLDYLKAEILRLSEMALAYTDPDCPPLAGAEGLKQAAEIMFDGCDAVADRLDALEAEGIDISDLHQRYSRLLAAVEAMHEIFETFEEASDE